MRSPVRGPAKPAAQELKGREGSKPTRPSDATRATEAKAGGGQAPSSTGLGNHLSRRCFGRPTYRDSTTKKG